MKDERNSLSGMMERMQDGVILVGPDYKTMYMNERSKKDFGDGVGSCCYKVLRGPDAHRQPQRKLPDVLKGEVQKWEYNFPDGRAYAVQALSFTDIDGVVCQLMALRKTPGSKNITDNRENASG